MAALPRLEQTPVQVGPAIMPVSGWLDANTPLSFQSPASIISKTPSARLRQWPKATHLVLRLNQNASLCAG